MLLGQNVDFEFFQKMVKNDQKWSKMNIFEKKNRIFFFKWIQNVSKRILNRKSWFRKKIPVENFFLGLNHFLTKMAKKWKLSKKNFENFFFESIQNISKRIFNWKGWFRNKFPVEDSFLGLQHFWLNWSKKNSGIDSKYFKTYFKPKKLVPKKFPVENF